ncbi:hypothetical protein J6590_028893 [Homalodisca vitripennis]|nr:hypothetical protein J6590_028893 [Homalodisca vitripennis]
MNYAPICNLIFISKLAEISRYIQQVSSICIIGIANTGCSQLQARRWVMWRKSVSPVQGRRRRLRSVMGGGGSVRYESDATTDTDDVSMTSLDSRCISDVNRIPTLGPVFVYTDG